MRIGAPKQSLRRKTLHQAVHDAVEQAMQAYLEKVRAGYRVVVDLQNRHLYYGSLGCRDRLRLLEKKILLLLANESLSLEIMKSIIETDGVLNPLLTRVSDN